MAETIGRQLKLAREAKNLTIQQVVQATHIRGGQIKAIETDDIESLPSPVQARAYIRIYAEFLGVSFDKKAIEKEKVIDDPRSSPPVEAVIVPKPRVKHNNFNESTPGSTGNIRGIQIPEEPPIRKVGVNPNQKTLPLQRKSKNTKINISHKELEKEVTAAPEGGFASTLPGPVTSHVIFIDVGRCLRERRENLSLTLEEISRHTHAGTHYLRALEAGEFDLLPSSVQARGMLIQYARFLNLDEDEILLKFVDGLQAQRIERQTKLEESSQKANFKLPFIINLPRKIKIPASLRRYFSVDIIVGGGLVLLLLTFAIWDAARIISIRSASTEQPTAPSFMNVLISSPQAFTPTAESPVTGSASAVLDIVETFAVTIPPAGLGPVQIVVVAQEQAWVRVTVDGKVKFEGRVNAGSAYPFDGSTQIEVLTGNGRAISILYNQNNLGPMGDFGEVVDHIYTANAILNPTATFTPSPTITQTPTITLRPTATLRPSSTPRPTTTPRASPTPRQ
jgi:cytoskeletal protein RodZ